MPHLRLLATVLLVGVTAIWGFTFVTVKEAISRIPTFQFLAMRFLIATILLFVLFPRQATSLKRPTFVAGTVAGLALCAGYAFQTVGLQYTGATKAGFITGLAVVFTPAIAALVLKRPPGGRALVSVTISALGLALLTAGTSLDFNVGDGIVLFCAISFALHIVVLGRFSPLHDARTLTIVQLGLSGTVFSVASLVIEDIRVPDGTVWGALALTAIGASAAAFLIQTWAQRHLSPTTTAVTFTMEPVFAGLAGFLLLGERFLLRNWVGAALILAAMLLVTLRGTTNVCDLGPESHGVRRSPPDGFTFHFGFGEFDSVSPPIALQIQPGLPAIREADAKTEHVLGNGNLLSGFRLIEETLEILPSERPVAGPCASSFLASRS